MRELVMHNTRPHVQLHPVSWPWMTSTQHNVALTRRLRGSLMCFYPFELLIVLYRIFIECKISYRNRHAIGVCTNIVNKVNQTITQIYKLEIR